MHAKGTGLPAPAHSLPPDANAADYNLMMDQVRLATCMAEQTARGRSCLSCPGSVARSFPQLVSEADRLDVQFSTHLSLMDQRGDAEGVSAVALSTSLLDAGPSRGHTPAPDAAGSGVEGPAASASANRAEAGASTHAAMAGVDAPAATAGAASPDAADSDEDEDAGEELLESRIATRATRRAVASGQVVGRSALKPRKSMKVRVGGNRGLAIGHPCDTLGIPPRLLCRRRSCPTRRSPCVFGVCRTRRRATASAGTSAATAARYPLPSGGAAPRGPARSATRAACAGARACPSSPRKSSRPRRRGRTRSAGQRRSEEPAACPRRLGSSCPPPPIPTSSPPPLMRAPSLSSFSNAVARNRALTSR